MRNLTQDRWAAIAFRWFMSAVLALCVFASSAAAQPAEPAKASAINGVYIGTCPGEKGPIKIKLWLTQQGKDVVGVFTWYLPEGSGTRAYACNIGGAFAPADGKFTIFSARWETPLPTDVMMRGLDGVFDPAGGNGAGQIAGDMLVPNRGPKFEAIRDPAESAKVAGTTPPTFPAPARAKSVAPPEGARGRSALADAPPPGFIEFSDNADRNAINGVYTGTYGTNADDNVTAKLYVKSISEGARTTLTGLLTFDVPLAAGPVTYAYKLTGKYEGMIDFYAAEPLGKSAPDAYVVKSLTGSFARGPDFRDGKGQVKASFNPDQISGKVIGSNNRPRSTFDLKRDKDESAKVDSLMAAQANAAGPVVSAPAPAPAAVQPSLLGVFNGTYTREKEPPTKFKLTITQTRYDGAVPGIVALAGMATIYLPDDSGTKAYTYRLSGNLDPNGNGDFDLHADDWVTMRPTGFQNFRGMGFDGKFLSNVTQGTARIVSIPTHDAMFIPTFEATWSPAESADIKGTLTAQKAVRDADQVAALKARDELIKNAPPKQLASKDLVRKSQAYWNAYRGDSVRQIFDGGFADDAGDDPSFQVNFITYVDLFSKNCSADLPANHHPITIVTTTYDGGQVVKKESKTIDIDPRFIKKYCEFSEVEPDPGSAEAADQAAKEAHIFRRVMQAGSPAGKESTVDAIVRMRLGLAHAADDVRDLNKFFATEKGSSAAMRQLTENFLRAATGEPSLQEAGAKIDRAQAETDKDVPPGRFTHLIDAANAFTRDPANASFRSKYDNTFYMLLAEKYRGVMTPQEEYYYANDFLGRFRSQIMGARDNSSDAAWPRLNPAFEECMKELGR